MAARRGILRIDRMPYLVLKFPDFDPVLVQIGPFAIRWYALAYIGGIVIGWLYAKAIVRRESVWGGAAPITTVDFHGGVDILPFCFMAVIIGGLGNLPGTAAAAVLLAFLEGIIQSAADPTVARIASLVLMSAVLLLRPQGLFKGLTR